MAIDPLNKQVTEALNAMRMQLAAGVGLEKSLKTSSDVIRRGSRAHGLMRRAADDAAKGEPFENILERLSPLLSYPERTILGAGWEGGRADWAMRIIVDERRTMHEVRRQIRSQLIFPMMIFFAACFIAPAPALLVPILSGEGQPDYTAYFVSALTPLGIAFGIFLLFHLVQRSRARAWANLAPGAPPPRPTIFDRLLLKIPIVAQVQRWKNLGEFASLLGNLFGAGVSVFAALDMTARAISNGLYRGDVMKIKRRIEKGDPLYVAIPRGWRWPSDVVAILEVGYESGKEDEVLNRLGNHARERYIDATKSAGRWVGRIVYVIVAIFILIQIGKLLAQIGQAYQGIL